MEKYLKVLLSALLIILTIWACKDSFLEETPVGTVSDKDANTRNGAEEALVGAYAVLDGQISSTNWNAAEDNWIYGSVAGGDAHKGSNSGDQAEANQIERYENSPTNGYFSGKWSGVYEGVARSNAALRLIMGLTAEVIADSDKVRLIGEARFLRGHYHFEAKKMFNNIPYVDETVEYGKNNYIIANTEDVWPKIQEDLQFAYDNLPALNTQIGRVNKYAAGAMLAKCLLFQGKYGEALPILNDVIINGVDPKGDKYALAPNYHFNFNVNYENGNGYDGTESIFAVQASVNDGGGGFNSRYGDVLNFPYNEAGGVPGGCCGFFQPSFEFVNSFRTDLAGLPMLDGSYNNEINRVKNDMGIPAGSAYTPDATQTLDPRLDWSVGRRGIPFLDWGIHPGASWIRDQTNGGPYTPKKNIYYKADAGKQTHNGFWTNGLVSINYNLIRFADVLLWAAEAEVEVGDPNKALIYVNMVRNRAKNSPVAGAPATYLINPYPDGAFADVNFARTAVRFERKLELGMEGHRFFDLVRWGIAKDFIPTYIEYERQFLPATMTGAKFDPGIDEYFPIPQTQIDLSKGALKQNR